MATSNIEWTDRVWNPTVGCTKVSAGCKHCYAETMHARLTRMGQAKYAEPFRVVSPWPAQLSDPLTWRKPARIFVNSMSDLFHEDVPDEYIDEVLAVMLLSPQHTYQVLTKRAARLPRYLGAPDLYERVLRAAGELRRDRPELTQIGISNPSTFPAKWIWWGVSVENQEQADARIPHLLSTPAAVRFLSCEPLLERVDLTRWMNDPRDRMVPAQEGAGQHAPSCRTFRQPWGIDWVIVGGESGRGARPFDLEWARSVVRQCHDAKVPVFVKQLGARPQSDSDDDRRHCGDMNLPHPFRLIFQSRKGGDPVDWPDDLRVRELPVIR